MNWKPYDSSWLCEIAQKELPDEKWLHAALSRCSGVLKESKAYIYFVNPSHPNQEGAEWQFDENIILDHPTKGELVLDILKEINPGEGRRVGGVEFLDKLD